MRTAGRAGPLRFPARIGGSVPRAALKTPWSDGTRHLLLSPMELLEKLAALVPPPRFHLLRYHGVLAPRALARDLIVPAEPAAADGSASAASCGHRLRWATLLARVFSSDLSECAACGGRLRIIAALTDPASIRCHLTGIGLSARPPALAPARTPPQPPFEFAACPAFSTRRRRRAYGGGCPQRSLRPRIDPDTGLQATKLLRARSKDWQRSSGELPDPCGTLSALTESPKKVPHFTYTFDGHASVEALPRTEERAPSGPMGAHHGSGLRTFAPVTLDAVVLLSGDRRHRRPEGASVSDRYPEGRDRFGLGWPKASRAGRKATPQRRRPGWLETVGARNTIGRRRAA